MLRDAILFAVLLPLLVAITMSCAEASNLPEDIDPCDVPRWWGTVEEWCVRCHEHHCNTDWECAMEERALTGQVSGDEDG